MKQILNCKTSDCPRFWEKLTEGDNAFTKFCHVCFKKVILVEDSKLCEFHVQSGTLVASSLPVNRIES